MALTLTATGAPITSGGPGTKNCCWMPGTSLATSAMKFERRPVSVVGGAVNPVTPSGSVKPIRSDSSPNSNDSSNGDAATTFSPVPVTENGTVHCAWLPNSNPSPPGDTAPSSERIANEYGTKPPRPSGSGGANPCSTIAPASSTSTRTSEPNCGSKGSDATDDGAPSAAPHARFCSITAPDAGTAAAIASVISNAAACFTGSVLTARSGRRPGA